MSNPPKPNAPADVAADGVSSSRGVEDQTTGPVAVAHASEGPPDTNSGEAPKRPTLVKKAVFIGLGLMGGSLARATRAAFPNASLCGVDREVIVDVALEQGIVDHGADPDGAAELIVGADLVVLCLPVLAVIETLEDLAPVLKDGPVITDTGSTKRHIAEAAGKLGLDRFVGSHPMTGKAAGGLAHADPALLRRATWFICPQASTDPSATRFLRTYIGELGANPVEIDADEHDRAVALTSQLPHLLANTLAETVLDEGAMEAAGGSLRDILKVAGAPHEVWTDSIQTNRAAVSSALRDFSRRLDELADSLDDKRRLRNLFARGRAGRERTRS